MTVKNNTSPPLRVLVVCLGNICRSPAAQGILEADISARGLNICVDSAGTAAYHQGNPPDKRSVSELALRGIDIQALRARQVQSADFEAFDWVLAMDKSNLSNLISLCPTSLKGKVRLFSSFKENTVNDDVDDPYYGAVTGFADMADNLASLSQQFLDYIESNP